MFAKLRLETRKLSTNLYFHESSISDGFFQMDPSCQHSIHSCLKGYLFLFFLYNNRDDGRGVFRGIDTSRCHYFLLIVLGDSCHKDYFVDEKSFRIIYFQATELT